MKKEIFRWAGVICMFIGVGFVVTTSVWSFRETRASDDPSYLANVTMVNTAFVASEKQCCQMQCDNCKSCGTSKYGCEMVQQWWPLVPTDCCGGPKCCQTADNAASQAICCSRCKSNCCMNSTSTCPSNICNVSGMYQNTSACIVGGPPCQQGQTCMGCAYDCQCDCCKKTKDALCRTVCGNCIVMGVNKTLVSSSGQVVATIPETQLFACSLFNSSDCMQNVTVGNMTTGWYMLNSTFLSPTQPKPVVKDFNYPVFIALVASALINFIVSFLLFTMYHSISKQLLRKDIAFTFQNYALNTLSNPNVPTSNPNISQPPQPTPQHPAPPPIDAETPVQILPPLQNVQTPSENIAGAMGASDLRETGSDKTGSGKTGSSENLLFPHAPPVQHVNTGSNLKSAPFVHSHSPFTYTGFYPSQTYTHIPSPQLSESQKDPVSNEDDKAVLFLM